MTAAYETNIGEVRVEKIGELYDRRILRDNRRGGLSIKKRGITHSMKDIFIIYL